MVALHDAVEDSVGDGGIADPGMPVFDRQLAGDDGGLAACAVIDDLAERVEGQVLKTDTSSA